MLWWTLQTLLVTAVLAAAVWGVCRVGKLGPVGRHALWLVVLLKMLTPPMVAWPWAILPAVPAPMGDSRLRSTEPTAMHIATVAAQSAVPIDHVAATADQLDTSAAPFPSPRTTSPITRASPQQLAVPQASAPVTWFGWLLPIAARIWLAGSIGFGLVQLVRIVRMLRRLRAAGLADAVVTRRVIEIAGRLKTRVPAVRRVAGIGSPLVWSLGRPLLCWPAELSGLSDVALSGLITHELAHLKRRDHWAGWLELLGGCVWWWNPLYWYVRHQLRENAELACDGWVVGTLPGGRRAYGEALLAVCECLSGQRAPMPSVGVGTGGRRFLERRLAMILRERISLRLSPVGLVVILLVAVVALPAWSQRARPDDSGVSLFGLRAGSTDLGAGLAVAPDARAVLEQFQQEQEQARLDADQRIEESRHEALKRLNALKAQYLSAGQLDEAAVVGNCIRQLEASAPRPTRLQPAPENMTAYRGRVGQKFLMDLVGTTEGPVWGTDVYTDDSALASAAVHAGMLKPGERGTVLVTMLPGRDSYPGASRFDVSSQSYAKWQGSYRIERATDASDVLPDPGTLVEYRDRVGQTFKFQVTGSTSGTIWGNDVYTDDSPLADVAVHAGVLGAGQTGVVQVTILPGRNQFEGVPRNGITSQPYGPFPGAYRMEPAQPDVADPGTRDVPASISSLQELRGKNGQSFLIEVTGSTRGQVWGSGIYTDDSSLPAAAVHAGVLRDGQRGTVKVTILPGRQSYEGESRNGVISQPWASWDGSFRVERADGVRLDVGRPIDPPPPTTY
jgi:beta-lactamase regulating signal transducer with metallopeptidase domain